jgi:hypothetical protein
MILIISAWIYLFLLCLSLGATLDKLLSRYTAGISSHQLGVFYQFWLGFMVLIGLLQAISLFSSLNKYVFIALSLLGLLSAIFNFRQALPRIRSIYNAVFTAKGFVSLLSVLILLCVVSYSANREVLHSDTFLYHYNSVKWAKEYPVVPGLANLHSRLGFNSAFFLFAAFFEVGPLTNHSAHIAVSFLLVVCAIHWFFVITSRSESAAKRILCMMTFLYLLLHIISQIDVASLSTDYPMAVLCLIFCLVLLDNTPYKNLLLLSLAAVAFSFKLSGMLTIATAFVVLIATIIQTRQGQISTADRKLATRLTMTSLGFFFFLLAGFIIRNIVMSGWLIYPFPFGNLHLPWSVPKPFVIDLMDWIKSYPKIPGGANPTTIKENDFFFWFTQWFTRFKIFVESDMFFGSLFLLFWCVFQVRSFSKFIYAHLNTLLLVLFSVASIALWFTSAPDLRFGSIYFFLFFAGSVVLFYEGSRYKQVLNVIIPIVFVGQIIYRMPSYVFNVKPKLFTFVYTKQPKLKQVVGSPPGEEPALMLYMPEVGDGCGNSPLPCTPYAGGFLHNHRFIKQREPGNISKGFLPIE